MVDNLRDQHEMNAMAATVQTTPDSKSNSGKKLPDKGNSGILGRIKNLESRLAINQEEVRKSQNLRYDIFFNEMAQGTVENLNTEQCDVDNFDRYCDHLLVLDRSIKQNERTGQIIGSYRLLNQEQAASAGGFYSESEFDIQTLISRHREKNFLEFGRSCVLQPYRNKRTIELLWQGSWAYVRNNGIDVMFGCASFSGTDPAKLAEPLSFLYHHARAKDSWRVQAQGERVIDMNRISE
ncbi:MAG: GNAT family N-acetyltransferase, partial [Rhizobiaceae bacterium]|nr:GNAT family N-acetyltransferase [Rhizobiaceae bacterium]